MLGFRRMLVVAVVCLGSFAVAQNQRQQSNENAAASVFGPRWQQLSRDSGMIFSGTVLGIHTPQSSDQQAIPTVEVTFRVDRAIAGVRAREVLTIREWAGGWLQHPLHRGQRMLLLLYPPSRLGFTSPVGGTLGQVELSGKNNVIAPSYLANGNSYLQPSRISLSQLGRAMRAVRTFRSTRTLRGRETTGKE
jgi:hypothetical protein